MKEMKQTIINYLNNLVVEAAKDGAGDYSSLANERFIPLLELENARRKVLQGEHENYSEEILNKIDIKEQIEKKRAQVVNATHGYVFLQKNSSGQPGEAQEIMKNFAELLKEEIVSEAREELGKIIFFADLPSECQSKLDVRSWTNTRSLIDGKSYILKFIRSNNNIGENSQIKEKETDKGSVDISADEGENDYETALINAQTEVANIAERIGATTEFNEVLENDLRRLDELEYTKIRKLIDQKSEAGGTKFDSSLIEQIMAPTRTSEFQNKKRALLSLAPEYYIKKVEKVMRDLGHSDEEINLLIRREGIEEDWREDIRQRESDFDNLRKHVNDDLLSWIETLPAKNASKSPWSKSEKAGAIAIVVLVVGVGGIVLGKWIQSRKEPKKIEKRTLKSWNQKEIQTSLPRER